MISAQALSQQTEKILPLKEQDFDYAALEPETQIVVQQHTHKIRTLIRRSARDIIDIGQNLISVKEQLEHGQFRNWLKAEFDWSVRTAARFMQVATKFTNANLAHLDIAASALYLLAETSTPNEVQEEILKLAQHGESITHTKAKNILNQHKDAAMLMVSNSGNAIVLAKTMESEASTPAVPLDEVQAVEAESAAVVKPFEEQLLKKRETPAELQVNDGYNDSIPTANSCDNPFQKQAKIKVQSLPEVGHQICITNATLQNYKWFGEVAEVKETITTEITMVIRISVQPVED
ncbi:MAG: DUF3102 domain-containing protein [Pelatocladus maniniholoensis HA4357-MV3]|jgi:hypothetical protein|uniref:DUF3102 domain-containing protein n=1 Tax=Pelatocladus maniniholoensis HA4357-MV3 TaxID=1117104 RepID=A0A9E3H5U4_9NOST|nr:DUF3102 domain-containing protein [Pelatocladus maniniholoensis HA4357-MV3]